MSEQTELIRHGDQTEAELTIEQLGRNLEKLRDVMKSLMRADTDYGVIPGTKSKPTLLKPGGEKLAQLFRLAPEFIETVNSGPGDHREYQVKCRLIHIPTGNFVGEASAVCSTFESKYRYRGGSHTCPTCGKQAIIKGKAEYGGGWICFKKKDGCGAKFPEDAFSMADLAKVENPDLADQWNTVRQIAQKRAFLSAIKTATASSELFTVDMEDHIIPQHEHDDSAAEPRREADAFDRKQRGRQSVSGEENQTHEPVKPNLSKAFIDLRETLVAMGVPPGPQDPDRKIVNAVCKYGFEGSTIALCAKDASLATKTLDGLLARAQVGDTVLDLETVYSDALKASGISLEPAESECPL